MQALSKQLRGAKQVKRQYSWILQLNRLLGKKEKEKDTRLQILEKTLERHREDLKKEKEDHHKEKEKSQKIRKTIIESREIVTQQRTKLSDELKKHKEALRALQDEVEKLKNSGGSQMESTSVAQPACGELESATTDIPLDNTSSAGAPVGQAVTSLTQTPAVDSFCALKRPSASVSSDLQDEVLAPEETSSDTPAPLLKKSKKASESPQEVEKNRQTAPVKLSEVVPIEESSDDAGNLQQGINKEEHADAEREEFETAGEQVGRANNEMSQVPDLLLLQPLMKCQLALLLMLSGLQNKVGLLPHQIQERARQRAHLRQAGLIASSRAEPVQAIRGRGARGGRTPRGQSPS
ncbi:hypothetical protein Salat_0636000 [Sesamum alatum]|uniref:Uncharacterized protein n=1 Tax=Sesamum alatum TaxID=300844 RepID=A0AAE2CU90_9LAMI|nr:hypothetical protein Salat_0636000 [Sesamum alatum]